MSCKTCCMDPGMSLWVNSVDVSWWDFLPCCWKFSRAMTCIVGLLEHDQTFSISLFSALFPSIVNKNVFDVSRLQSLWFLLNWLHACINSKHHLLLQFSTLLLSNEHPTLILFNFIKHHLLSSSSSSFALNHILLLILYFKRLTREYGNHNLSFGCLFVTDYL